MAVLSGPGAVLLQDEGRMGKQSKDNTPTVYGIPGDLHLIAKLKIETEEEAEDYLTGLNKEILNLSPSKYFLPISRRIKAARDALSTDGLEAAMSYVREIPHLLAVFIEKSKAGSRPKKAKGLMRQVEELLCDNPRMKVQEVWRCFPDRDLVPIKIDGKRFELERYGDDRICEYEFDKKGDDVNKKTVKRSSFGRYVTQARKNLNLIPQ